MQTTSPVDRVIFFLGRVMLEEFMEILLLCGNGYGIGGHKLLRGLYERAVTAAYLVQYPEEVDAFLRYNKVHLGKMLNHTAQLFDLKELFAVEKIDEIRRDYEEAKREFQEPLCKACGTTRTQMSWSKLDIGAMAKKADEGLAKLYLQCYFMPTLHSHSTMRALFSQMTHSEGGSGLTFDDQAQREHVDEALRAAHLLILMAIDTQSIHFKLGLNEEIAQCRGDWAEAWGRGSLPSMQASEI